MTERKPVGVIQGEPVFDCQLMDDSTLSLVVEQGIRINGPVRIKKRLDTGVCI